MGHSSGWRRCWATLVSVGLLAIGYAQPAQPKEYHIKAIFLFNFVQFVEWPDIAFADGSTPITIGILGDDPFGPSLDEVIRDEKVKGRPLTVVRARRLSDLSACHLIFVSKSESRRLEDVLSQLSNRPVLTVSELDGFAQRGGVIAFFSEGKKVRFEINPSSAKRVQLKISSELLGLGKITGPNSAGGLD